MNGIHSHKCRNCGVTRECPQVTHCKRPPEVDECFDCYANRIQLAEDARGREGGGR